jgi:hypothetical protein
MSRKSFVLNGRSLLTGGLIALAISTGAIAAPVEVALSCPGGTHVGYEGKYCWPNRPRACPVGYHLGYEGKYCWSNR